MFVIKCSWDHAKEESKEKGRGRSWAGLWSPQSPQLTLAGPLELGLFSGCFWLEQGLWHIHESFGMRASLEGGRMWARQLSSVEAVQSCKRAYGWGESASSTSSSWRIRNPSFCEGIWAIYHHAHPMAHNILFCKINCRRANAHEFRKLGIRGGNETHGQFLSALLIEMVLIKWISVWERRYDAERSPMR